MEKYGKLPLNFLVSPSYMELNICVCFLFQVKDPSTLFDFMFTELQQESDVSLRVFV